MNWLSKPSSWIIRSKFSKYFLLLIVFAQTSFSDEPTINVDTSTVTGYVVDPGKSHLRLYWKEDKGNVLKSINNLKSFVEAKDSHLLFAMNGGMYKPDNTPQGLYIENGKMLSPLDTNSGAGNFYLQPNGVFYITSGQQAVICKTKSFLNKQVLYATQSGPMLVYDNSINPAFRPGSANLNIRNGVGILPDGKVIFAISKGKINFYDFAMYFKSLGCHNALYLDGFVSRLYLPQKGWQQTDGDFGVMMAVTDK